MSSQKTKLLVYAAVCSALCCVATMSITIPSPTGGYIHIGDSMVILSGILLGPLYGGIAAGLGSMCADLLLGYTNYMIPTLVIKFIAAMLVGITYRSIYHKSGRRIRQVLAVLMSGIISCITVVIGYLLYDVAITKNIVASAIASIGGNLIQGMVGTVIALLLISVLPSRLFYIE